MTYGSLQAEYMEIKHNGIGMEYLSLATLLFIYVKRLNIIIKYFEGFKIQLDSTCQVFFTSKTGLFSF